MKQCIRFFLLLLICFHSQLAVSNEPPATPKIVYFTLKPEIVINYINTGTKLGFLTVTIKLMMKNSADLAIVEYHQPLILDTIITVLSRESEESVKSLAGRELIRQSCLNAVNKVLTSEVDTEDNIVADLLFTKYLYQ